MVLVMMEEVFVMLVLLMMFRGDIDPTNHGSVHITRLWGIQVLCAKIERWSAVYKYKRYKYCAPKLKDGPDIDIL